MTGNVRSGLGLLVVAVLAGLAWFAAARADSSQMVTAFGLATIVLVVAGLVRVASGLLKPTRG